VPKFKERLSSALRDVPKDAFEALDGDSNGEITLEEFRLGTNSICSPPITETQATSIYGKFDVDNDNKLTLMEFANAMQQNKFLEPVVTTQAPLTLDQYRARMGHVSEVATVSVHITLDFNKLSTMEKSNVKAALVKVLADTAGVSTSSVRDLANNGNSLDLSANNLGTPGSNEAGTTAQAMIDIPSGPVAASIVHGLANATTKHNIAASISAVPGVLAATGGAHLDAADVLIAARRQNKQAWRTIDTDKSGILNYNEFQSAGQAFSPPLTEHEAHYAFEGLDSNRDDNLDPLEFQGYGIEHFFEEPGPLTILPVTAAETQSSVPITVQDFKQRMGEADSTQVFNTLDATGDGMLDLNEMVMGGEAFTPAISSQIAEYVFRGLDINGDNHVTKHEWDMVLHSGHFFTSTSRRLRSTEPGMRPPAARSLRGRAD
jgi:Ca2+-binding EF-hand superfamily protein